MFTKKKQTQKETKQRFSPVFFLFFFCLFMGFVFAKNQGVSVYGIVKFLEMLFFGWYTAYVLRKRISYTIVGVVLAGSVLFESVVALLQFYSHGSVGGVLYFFGERTFSSLTPGIANASVNGQLLLRPYGTLPHPNVLAGYLLLSGIFIVSLWQRYGTWQRWMVSVSLGMGIGALLFSLSRITILLFFCLLFFAVFLLIHDTKKRIIVGVVGLSGILGGLGLFGTVILNRFASSSFIEESFLVRVDLAKNAVWMIQNYPLFGVGSMNFLVRLPAYAHPYSFYQYLQPVHNIYLLIAAEIGIIGLGCVLWFLYKTIRQIQICSAPSVKTMCFLLLGSTLFLGVFDHYFLTLQSGQLLLSFVLGVCWSTSSQVRRRVKAKAFHTTKRKKR
jgi:O-antigen ligase